MWLENRHVRARSHLLGAHLPVYSLDRSPWQTHLFCDHFPHCLLESTKRVKLVDTRWTKTVITAQGITFGALHKANGFVDIGSPVVQPCKLILLLVVPFLALLAIILVPQTATDRAPPRQFLRNVVPFHSIPAKLNRKLILLGRPFPLLFWRSW